MKIDPNLTIGNITGNKTGVKPLKQGDSFEQMLQGVENTEVKSPVQIHQIPPITQVSPQKINALSLSEQALDMMDKYAKALLEPHVNLKSLSPMVDDLDGMRNKLKDAGNFISKDDPLKSVMDNVEATLYGEVLRFRRGDLV